jgi:hypothetical protein
MLWSRLVWLPVIGATRGFVFTLFEGCPLTMNGEKVPPDVGKPFGPAPKRDESPPATGPDRAVKAGF